MHRESINMLRVNVDQIPEDGLVVRIDASYDKFPGLGEVCLQEEISFASPLHLDIRVRIISNFVEASGKIGTSVNLACSRCLVPFTQEIVTPFEALYTEEVPDPELPEADGEIELTSEAIDVFPILGKQMDLSEAIREQVLLALPVRPLCREDCKGLCAGCGADLNQGSCGCQGEAVDPRFAVLKNLKIEKH
jgi:uncharacterized protein